MIPLYLTLSGFLSYRDPQELDFTRVDLACISGHNGAGKSSLLDAITWVVFGQARKRDESIINIPSNSAEVSFIFAYEGRIYRIQRTMPRGKTSLLEFQISQKAYTEMGADRSAALKDRFGPWRPLTEATQRATQARIEETLSLDYDTFINASFFLQGKADQFTQQRPGDRKRILSSILGLDIWEQYRQKTAESRLAVERDIAATDANLSEIRAELSQESARKEKLAALVKEVERLSQLRKAQEKTVEQGKKLQALLNERERQVDNMKRRLDGDRQKLAEIEATLQARQAEQQSFTRRLEQAAQIEAAYLNWKQACLELEQWEATASRFREQQALRQGPIDQINAERARLKQELDTLEIEHTKAQAVAGEIVSLHPQIEKAQADIRLAEERISQKSALEGKLHQSQQSQADAAAENNRLRPEMNELKKRINLLKEAEGEPACPVCGHPLKPNEVVNMIAELEQQGTALGDRHRANDAYVNELKDMIAETQKDIQELAKVEQSLRAQSQAAGTLTARLELLDRQKAEWESQGVPRLAAVRSTLAAETFLPEARRCLAEIDVQLKEIGYDAAAHDGARKVEQDGRVYDEEMRLLEKSRAALEPLEREIAGLDEQCQRGRADLLREQTDYETELASLQEMQADTPNLREAEIMMLEIQQKENEARRDMGGAQQQVDVLETLKGRQKLLETQREERTRLVGQYKQLERAFSKDGIPALLIEQALPQIEVRANEILERLSGGTMSVRFITQSAYKDKRREDLRETLDIQISDSSGTRDYEMYSGGEAFRVNFAIRLALSEVLAQRAGARLQTLVVDEGFGSQDAQGRQRLVEAINMVAHDFEKILVITHIDELKDAFPSRIEVEKGDRGSVVRVI